MHNKFDIANKQLKNFINHNFAKIIEINEKYATPRIEMSKAVEISLFALRVYLFVLVGLLVYKFITLIH